MKVTALVFDGMKMLDLAGPFEVFAEAIKFGGRYELEVRSPDGAPVVSSTGIRVPVDGPAHASAGIDLALALVERDHGEEIARSVARSLVVFLQRPGGQSQFSPSLAAPRPGHQALRQVTDEVAADPAGDHSVTALAARAHLSPRHLARMFQQELGTSPSRYVESVRIDAAVRLLHEGRSVTASAQEAGIGSPETLRRIFLTRFGVSPRAYQQRFARARP